MTRNLTISRRGLLGSMAALGAAGVVAGGAGRLSFAQTAGGGAPTGGLPAQGEFIVKNAYVLTMDPQLGEISGGDIHVRNGVLVAVGRNLSAPNAQIVNAEGMIALPGFIETHWHMWGAVARNMAGPT